MARGSERSWKMWVILGLVYVIAFLTLAKEDWITGQLLQEQNMARVALGEDRANRAIARANGWYEHAFVDSGVQDNSFHLLVPTEEQLKAEPVPNAGKPLWDFVEQRLRVLWTVLYQALQRASLAFVWAPIALVVAGAFMLDGWVARRIKQTNFDYASPARHRYAVFAMDVGLALFMFSLFLPAAINPFLIPAFFLLLAAATGVLVANVQKKL